MADNKKKVDSYGNIEGEPTAYDNYAEALKNLQERDDIETREAYLARTQPKEFDEADFVREGEAQGVVTSNEAAQDTVANTKDDEVKGVASAASKKAEEKK